MNTHIAIALSSAVLSAVPAMAQQPPIQSGRQQGRQAVVSTHHVRVGESRLSAPAPLPPADRSTSADRAPDCADADRDASGRCRPRPR